MDRTRFEHLLSAYGGDFRRWPSHERASAAVFAAQADDAIASLLVGARALDAVLDQARAVEDDTTALAGRILAAAPRRRRLAMDVRAAMALAACAVFGVILGYGGGLLAPPADGAEDYFAMAFETPVDELGEEG